jgi:Protein of unknown function (DUF3168)
MSDPSLELQLAIVARLKGDSGVQGVVGQRIYDEVPINPTFPYISIGDNQVLPDKADCIDGTEIFWQLDGWARDKEDPPTCKQISKAVVAAMDDLPLTITGYDNIVCELNTINYLHDPDGTTRHVAINFRFLIQAS